VGVAPRLPAELGSGPRRRRRRAGAVDVRGDHEAFVRGRAQRLSRIETRLADFSMTVTAYYGKLGEQVPADFDEAELFRVLGEAYPRQADV
jgi:hypothetical protein